MQLDGLEDLKIGMIRDSKISLGCEATEIASVGDSTLWAVLGVQAR